MNRADLSVEVMTEPEARQSVGVLGYGATCRAEALESEGRFRNDTPPLAAGSFIKIGIFFVIKNYTCVRTREAGLCHGTVKPNRGKR